MQDNASYIALNISSLTLIAFTLHLLATKARRYPYYQPLMLTLFAISVLLAQRFTALFFPQQYIYTLFMSLPALLALAPAFWLYVVALTHETRWRPERKYLRHFALSGFGLIIVLLTLSLPDDLVQKILTEEDERIVEELPFFLRYMVYGILISTFALVLGWIAQSGIYVVLTFVRLKAYRRRLKDEFSGTEKREAKWINGLLVLMILAWLIGALNIATENLGNRVIVSDTITAGIYLLLIWMLAIWGLQQKPGFSDNYPTEKQNALTTKVAPEQQTIPELQANSEQQSKGSKYQKSALSSEQAQRIANAIESAMNQDKLYLDNNLSLQKLASHISTPGNYVTQTLNETMRISFFDLINKHRVIEASQKLCSSDLSVIEIAMEVGFNSKSSFYNVFKREFEQTPLQYRRHCR